MRRTDGRTDRPNSVRDTAGTHGCAECENSSERTSNPWRVATDKVAAAPLRSVPFVSEASEERRNATQRGAPRRAATVSPVPPFPSIVAFLPSIAVQRSSGVRPSVRSFVLRSSVRPFVCSRVRCSGTPVRRCHLRSDVQSHSLVSFSLIRSPCLQVFRSPVNAFFRPVKSRRPTDGDAEIRDAKCVDVAVRPIDAPPRGARFPGMCTVRRPSDICIRDARVCV